MNKLSLECTEPVAGPSWPIAGAPTRRSWVRGPVPILLIAVATLAAHGASILDGLFLDDHLHVVRFRSNEWSLRHWLEATTIVPEEFMETWWQDQSIRWQYARPFSVLLAQTVYHLFGESVKALHGLSVALHFAGAVMIFYLCCRLTRSRGWSLVGALLFVVHSHSVYAVGWLAAQNCVLQTVLTLAALLCYIRASGLDVYAGAARPLDQCVREPEARAPARNSPAWFLLSLGFWILALASRENALVFPVFAAAFDLAFGGWRHIRRRVPAYALMGALAVAFALWRLIVFYHPMPDFYVRRYDGAEYLWWWLAKLLHYVTGVVWLSPLMVGPSARFNPFREVPGDCLLMIGIIGVMFLGYWLACRRARGWWIWPLWIFLSLLPVVPVFAAPHSAYMPAVGFAVAMILGPALRHEIQPASIGRWCPGVAIWFLIATTTYMPIYHTFWSAVQSAEKFTIAQMAADPPGPATREIFLINLPFVNIYTRLHLAEQLQGAGGASEAGASSAAILAGAAPPENLPEKKPVPDFRCHVLTYAPNVLRMEEDCRLEQIDAHTFRLTIEGRYFEGALGRYLIESMRPSGRFKAGEVVHGRLFDVEVVRADEVGVQELQFRFHRPLASPEYCFYLTTNRQAAVRVHFWESQEPAAALSPQPGDGAVEQVQAAVKRLHAGEAAAANILFEAMNSDDAEVRAVAVTEFRRVALPVSQALASPIQELLKSPSWDPQDQVVIRQWWGDSVRDRTLQVLWVRRSEWEAYQSRRDRLFSIQWIARHVIRTDLYMTGPPFPGPR